MNNRRREVEIKEIFDFISRAGRSVESNKSKTFDECLEDAGMDIQHQHNYIVRLLDETDELQDELYKEIQERLIDYELHNQLDEEVERDEVGQAIDILEEELEYVGAKYCALLDMYSDISDEVMGG